VLIRMPPWYWYENLTVAALRLHDNMRRGVEIGPFFSGMDLASVVRVGCCRQVLGRYIPVLCHVFMEGLAVSMCSSVWGGLFHEILTLW